MGNLLYYPDLTAAGHLDMQPSSQGRCNICHANGTVGFTRANTPAHPIPAGYVHRKATITQCVVPTLVPSM